MSIVNHYRRRQVAANAEKPCSICYRPTPVVLMSVDSKDWFYCCAQHLSDPGFASPIKDAAAEAERLKKIEIAKVKAEYEAKEARKAELKKEAAEKKDKKDEKSWFSAVNPFGATKEKETPKATEEIVSPPSEAREFSLHRTLYQHRCNLKQEAAQEKARQAQWSQISFPTAPKS